MFYFDVYCLVLFLYLLNMVLKFMSLKGIYKESFIGIDKIGFFVLPHNIFVVLGDGYT